MTYQDSPYRQRPRYRALAEYEDSPYQDPVGGGYSGYQGQATYPDAFDGPDPYRAGYPSQQDGYRNQQTAYLDERDGYLDAFDGRDTQGYTGRVAYKDPHPSFPDGWDGYSGKHSGRGGGARQDTMVAPRPEASVPGDFGGYDDEGRGGLGLMVGSLTGVLAAAALLGVATLVAGFIGRRASPVSAIDGIFTAHVPSALRNSAAQHFGGHSKLALLLGMYLVVAIIAMVIGNVARHSRAIGVMGIGAFGLLAAYVVISRPGSQAADVIPSVIGALAGVTALLYLVRSSLPYTEAA